MNLVHPFYRFPFQFDAERLAAEVAAVPESEWCTHPAIAPGNTALPLISTRGEINDDFAGPLRPTKHLLASPYMRQVLAPFRTLLGRARLMRLDSEAHVPKHVDAHYYWRTHTRVHIPITTHPQVEFHCEDQVVNMAAGEAWTFDNWRMHTVVNKTPVRRVHLVFDTFGSAEFWKMARPLSEPIERRLLPYEPGVEPRLEFETRAGDPILPPGDVDCTLREIAEDVAANPQNDSAALQTLQEILLDLRRDWRLAWFAAEAGPDAASRFMPVLLRARLAVQKLPVPLRLASNRQPVAPILQMFFPVMLTPAAVQNSRASATTG